MFAYGLTVLLSQYFHKQGVSVNIFYDDDSGYIPDVIFLSPNVYKPLKCNYSGFQMKYPATTLISINDTCHIRMPNGFYGFNSIFRNSSLLSTLSKVQLIFKEGGSVYRGCQIDLYAKLTVNESILVHYLKRGFSLKQISNHLNKDVKCIYALKRRLMRKLGISNNTFFYLWLVNFSRK